MADHVANLLDGGLAALQDFRITNASEDQRAALCSVDGVQLIVQHLQGASDVQHIEHLCRILVDIFQQNPDLRSEGQLLAPLLARWMQEFGSVTMARRLLGLTVELGGSYSGGSIDRPHVLQQGAAAAIVSILQKHLHDPSQLEQDLAMATLLCGQSPADPTAEAPVNHEFLISAKLPEVLIEIIEMHTKLPDILVHALTTMVLLSDALGDAYRDPIYAERVATAVVAVMAAHETAPELQLPAALLLARLVEADGNTREAVVALQGPLVMQKVVERNREDHALVRPFVKLIAKIGKDAEQQKWCSAILASLPAETEDDPYPEDRYSEASDSGRGDIRPSEGTPRSSQPYTTSSQPPHDDTPRAALSSSRSHTDTPRSVEADLMEGCDAELDHLQQDVMEAHSPKDRDKKWRVLVRELYARLQTQEADFRREVARLQSEAESVAQATRLSEEFMAWEARLTHQEAEAAVSKAQVEADRQELQSRMKSIEAAESDVQTRMAAIKAAEDQLAEDYRKGEAALQDMLEKQRQAKHDLAEVSHERQELTDLRLKVSVERSEADRLSKATDAREARLQEAQRRLDEQLGDMEWREKSILNKEREGNVREQNLDRRDAEVKKREKAFAEKNKEQEARERQQVLKERELTSMVKDLERREIATRERVRTCDLREEAMEERTRDLASRETACQALKVELEEREQQTETASRDLRQREATVAELAEELRMRKELVDQREAAVTAREKAQKEQKKELREAKQKVQKREDEVMEWIKELQWREYDFQKREETDRSPLAPTAKAHKETFGESLISVQLGRLKDAYITSKERMLRQRVKPAPDIGRNTRDIMWQVKDYSAMKAMSYEVKEKSTDFRRMMARLRGLELDSESADDPLFSPEEVAELKRISASENDLSDEASFTLQVLACPMNDRHMFSNDTEVVLALEEWWIDARDRVHERYMGILRRRRQQLDHAMAILAEKRDAAPNLWVKRAVEGPVSPVAKKNGGLIFSASFPVGHATLRPIPDKWRHPYSKVEVKKPPYGRLPPPRGRKSPGKQPNKQSTPKPSAADAPHSEEEVFGSDHSDDAATASNHLQAGARPARKASSRSAKSNSASTGRNAKGGATAKVGGESADSQSHTENSEKIKEASDENSASSADDADSGESANDTESDADGGDDDDEDKEASGSKSASSSEGEA
eukprot:GGOE01004034.1.p1 GENE.GGOE01004034.1~~GGOE01004034.1.p1  ORF type:complete len:1185 (+),score=353.38 GGOE01004034.1:69-3623(+)